MRSAVIALVCLFFAIANRMGAQEPARTLDLVLPTDNDALYRGDGAAFYQVVPRDFQGVESMAWEGGQYGFVRDPVESAGGIIYKRFHEGIDIRPLRRDARGESLDEVRAIAEGKVVHTNLIPGFSNYGNYVVVEHRWDGASYYSLYGHLHSIAVKRGQKVSRGEPLGVMGHTGEGVDQARAHLHLELNLMLSREFESWYNVYFRDDANRHGLYNGLNLVGIDIARLYLALRNEPSLTIPEFLSRETIFYKVRLPDSRHFDLPKRYPWLLRADHSHETKSWDVSFAQSGVPLEIAASSKPVQEPELIYFKKSGGRYSDFTREILTGHGDHASLSENGRSWVRLFIYPD
jgi:murein DD-endopeptidase MepM/ murein hydrolase activator NlpD